MSCNQSRRSMNLGSLFIKQSTIMARVLYLHTISAYACNLTDIYLSGCTCRPPVSSSLHMTHIKISKLNQIMIGTNLVVALNGKDELVTTPVFQCQDPYYCIAFIYSMKLTFNITLRPSITIINFSDLETTFIMYAWWISCSFNLWQL